MLNDEAVLFANDAFYLALSQGDYPAMRDLWAKTFQVCCLHPGWEPLFGRESVLESWQGILEKPPTIQCLDPRVSVFEQSAAVVCYESIEGTFLAATNMFVLEDDQIRLVHHHAAPSRGRPSVDVPKQPIIN